MGQVLRTLSQVNVPYGGHVYLMVDSAGKNFMRVKFSDTEVVDFAIDFREVLNALVADGKYQGDGFVCYRDGVVLQILLNNSIGDGMLNRMDVLLLMFTHSLFEEIGKIHANHGGDKWY